MKNKTFKRSIAIVLCLAILAAIGIGAYLTDTEVKKDVYTVGNVQAEIVANGDMELDNVGALLPGTIHRYERAATNTGINDAYVFMSLTIPYEMVGAANEDGTQIGERVRQLFIPGHADGYIGSEWKLVDVGHIGQYEIEDNGQYCGEHDQYSVVVGDTITYIYGYIGDNADGSLKALASGETTSNLVETMELTNLYNVFKIDGEISTKLYTIQDDYVNGGINDVNGVWAVINKALFGDNGDITITYSITNTNTGEAVGYAPLRLVNNNGEVFSSVSNEDGTGRFHNIPTGTYTVETDVGDLSITESVSTYGLRRSFGMRNYSNKVASITVTESKNVDLGLTTPQNTIVRGIEFNSYIPANTTRVEFISNKTAPADAFDVSEAQDGSVMAWIEGSTMYVSAVNGDVIYANPNCNEMFKNKANLTYIDFKNLNTKNMTSAKYLLYGCKGISSSNITNNFYSLDFSNTKNLKYAFANCMFETITIPSYMTTIPEYTFANAKINSVVMSEGVEKIGQMAFAHSNMVSVSLPSSLKTIDKEAFFACGEITTITLPKNVEYIGDKAFWVCSKLTNVNVNTSNQHFTSVNGVLFSKDMKTLVYYPLGKTAEAYTIPNGVETVAMGAFGNAKITSIKFPSSIKFINEDAFMNCRGLISINFPSSLEEIGSEAFDSCLNLTTVTIPSSVTYIGGKTFNGTPWLKNKIAENPNKMIVINNLIIDASAASGDVVIPDGVTYIPYAAFSSNRNITSVYIPASVSSIENIAFSGCENLTTITFAENSQLKKITKRAFAGCFTLTSFEIPESVEYIGEGAFEYCYGFTNITIPANVKTIDFGIFRDCDNLTEINVSSANENYTSINGVLFTKNMKTLMHYPSAKTGENYKIPNNVQIIEQYAFYNNSFLNEITMSSNVKEIRDYAFCVCSNLKTINYLGTKAQWKEIELFDYWNSYCHDDLTIKYLNN